MLRGPAGLAGKGSRRVRILYVTAVRLDVAEAQALHVLDWCRAASRMGHEVTLVAPGLSRPVLPEAWASVRALTASFPRVRGGYRLYDWLSSRIVGRELERGEYDWAYLRAAPSRHLPAVMAAHPTPWAVEVNGAELAESPQFAEVARRATLVLADSEELRGQLLAAVAGLDAERVRVHPHPAVAPERFEGLDREECRSRLGLTKGEACFVNVSSFRWHHDHATLLAAAEAVALRRGAPVRLIMAGDGERLEETRRAAAALRGVRVEFPGSVSPMELPRLIAAADVCFDLVTAEKLRSGNLRSFKLYEYAAAGRPSVVAVDRSLPVAGWAERAFALVPPGDAAAAAEAALGILAAPEAWLSRAAEARGFVVRERSWAAAAAASIRCMEEARR
jgi:glycosyltransferase involved in cell wall biosynthesis